MKTPYPRAFQDGLGRSHEEGDGDPRQIVARGLATSGRVVGKEGAPGEDQLTDEVDVVILRGAETVEDDDGVKLAAAADRRNVEVHAVDTQVQPIVPESASRWHVDRHTAVVADSSPRP